jgi:hypothetical protein
MATSNHTAATAQATVPVVTGDPAVDAAIQDVKNARGAVQLDPPLTKQTRMRLVKVRRNGQQLIAPMFGLANRVPQLAPLGVTPVELTQKLGRYQNLVELQAVVESMAKAVGDTVAQIQAELWGDTMTIYGMASHNVGSDPDVANLVAQMKAALAYGPRIKTQVTRTPIVKPTKGARGSAANSVDPGGSPDSGSTAGGNGTVTVPGK